MTNDEQMTIRTSSTPITKEEMDAEVAARRAAGQVAYTREEAIEAVDRALSQMADVSDDQRAAIVEALRTSLP